jgi:hypothetical protein
MRGSTDYEVVSTNGGDTSINWILETGYWKLDTGNWIAETGYSMVAAAMRLKG